MIGLPALSTTPLPGQRIGLVLCLFFIVASGLSAASDVEAVNIIYPLKGNIAPREGTIAVWIKPYINPMEDSGRFYEFFIFRVQDSAGFNVSLIWDDKLGLKPYGTYGKDQPIRGFTTTRPLVRKGEIHWKRGEWHHVAFSWHENHVSLYFDGRPAASCTLSDPLYFRETSELTLGYGLSQIAVDEFCVTAAAHSADTIADWGKHRPVIDKKTLLIDPFEKLSADGSETVATLISGFSDESGGAVRRATPSLVDGRFGQALQLFSK